jgi:hypothetical protein
MCILHSTILGIHLFCLNSYHFSSCMVCRCQDIYESTKADGHTLKVTLTTPVEDSELDRPNCRNRHYGWEGICYFKEMRAQFNAIVYQGDREGFERTCNTLYASLIQCSPLNRRLMRNHYISLLGL